jgi:hypothetical protein
MKLEEFKKQTSDTIKSCARYLDEHADEFAELFCGGAKSWAIELRAGDDGMFPWVEIHTSSHNVAAVVPYGDNDAKPL